MVRTVKLLVLLTSASWGLVSGAAPQYSFEVVGQGPGGHTTYAVGLNDQGQIGGTGFFPSRGFVYSNGQTNQLGVGSALSGWAGSINNAGQVLGGIYDGSGSGASYTVRWGAEGNLLNYGKNFTGGALSPSGNFTVLNSFSNGSYIPMLFAADSTVGTPLISAGSGSALEVSDSGRVIGTYSLFGGNHSFYYDGELHDLGSNVSLKGMSAAGTMAATVSSVTGTHAALFDGQDYFWIDSLLGGAQVTTFATSISDSGMLGGGYSGFFSTESGAMEYRSGGFIYSESGLQLLSQVPGQLNNRGQWLGREYVMLNGYFVEEPFLYDVNGGRYDVGGLLPAEINATVSGTPYIFLNNSGQIAGQMSSNVGSTFLLSAVPEPSRICMAIAGLLMILCFKRWRESDSHLAMPLES